MNRYLNSLTLPLAVAMAVGTVDAKAQALEEVIVTAQKREQSLQDVPIAVAAFSNEMLQKAGVKDMFELQANDPSLVVGQGHNASTSSFGIRGVFTSSNNFGLESSVGLYVDGVYRARQGSMLNDLVDIGRIEILRGPQGTLFGRNTPCGSRDTTLSMVFKLLQSAQKRWKRIKGFDQLKLVVDNVQFQDGIQVDNQSDRNAA